jgi:GTPase Era involved in 16S rRNA processing
MKKNGRKYRKLHKTKADMNLNYKISIIEQDVDGIKTSYLSMSHIIADNPITLEDRETREKYIKTLKNYLKIGGWERKKYEKSLMDAYEKIIMASDECKNHNGFYYYKNFVVFDFMHLLGYEIAEKDKVKVKEIEKQYLVDFSESTKESNLFRKIVNTVQSQRGLNKIKDLLENEAEVAYYEKIKSNILFRNREQFGIMVTATMSAGKSTFINSLIGKYVCLSQNMACTSKIHSIINKPYEDGFFYEYDHDLVMTAGNEELLNDNELNTSDRIYVSTHYDGGLAEERIIINDSPGVNFSGDSEHKLISNELIKGRKYNLLIYVMNSTQLATNDEDEHLEFIKSTIGRTPAIFIMNKIDSYNLEEEDVIATIGRQIEYLKKKGFKNPIVCPVSARAGYLAKQFTSTKLSKSEERELYNYVDKFEQMKLSDYYEEYFPNIVIEDKEQEEQLLKTCGLAYVEQIIKKCISGGR